MEKINFGFTPTPDDYYNAVIAYNKRQWITYIVLAGMALMLVVGVLGLIYRFPDGRTICPSPPLLVIPLIGGVVIALMPWISASRTRNLVAKDEKLLSPAIWELDNEKVILKNRFGENRHDTACFQKVTETSEYFLLHYRDYRGIFQILPKRAFESPIQEAAFREWLKQHVPNYRG